MRLGALLLLLCDWLILESRASLPDVDQQADIRHVSYTELLESAGTHAYRNSHVTDISHVVQTGDGSLFVGARNHVLKLVGPELDEVQSLRWPPESSAVNACVERGQPREACDNYIRVLQLLGERLLVCGTYAFAPKCTWRLASALTPASNDLDGRGKCPYDPAQNNTALLLDNGDLLTATVTDYAGRDPLLLRSLGVSKSLRTVKFNNNWLNDPQFVAMYEVGPFIYVFFREQAVELSGCGQQIVSRVARLCKHDRGGDFLLEDNWTSFLKARLTCSRPGDEPFTLDYLQNTYFDTEKQRIYAVFTTGPSALPASAVCIYSLSDLDRVFLGPFRHQPDSAALWTSVPNNRGAQECSGGADSWRLSRDHSLSAQAPHVEALRDAQRYQLMAQEARPTAEGDLEGPYLFTENTRYSHVVVEHVVAKHHVPLTVLYATTLEGELHKLVRLPGGRDACLVEVLHLRASRPGPVRLLRLLGDALLVSTGEELLRVGRQRCERHRTRERCLGAQDPHCGWTALGSCTPPPDHLPDHDWHQNITGCPQLQYPVDGGWSAWGEWGRCDRFPPLATPETAAATGTGSDDVSSRRVITGGNHVTGCVCRSRFCDRPRPLHGGLECEGPAIQVTNCTVHGGWTEWSDWSACGTTCGLHGQRKRQRTCSNPSPAHGGRVCVGHDRGLEACPDMLPCPEDVPLPTWRDWSPWSRCSAECNTGVQYRARQCSLVQAEGQDGKQPGDQYEDQFHSSVEDGNQPVGLGTDQLGAEAWALRSRPVDWVPGEKRVLARYCEGNNQEWRICNTQQCPEIRETSEWSDWLPGNFTREHVQTRAQSVCTANVPEGTNIRARLRVKTRFCPRSESGDSSLCSDTLPPGYNNNQNGGVGGAWGESEAEEELEPEQCDWTLWSTWSSCDSVCGGGEQTRMRSCMGTSGRYGGLAARVQCGELHCGSGSAQQLRQCNVHSCEGVWSCWSTWSNCTGPCSNEFRFRTRQCIAEVIGQEFKRQCREEPFQQEACEAAECGSGWDAWSAWSECSTWSREQERARACRSHVTPSTCQGASREKRLCPDVDNASPRLGASLISPCSSLRAYHLLLALLLGLLVGAVTTLGLALYFHRHGRSIFAPTSATVARSNGTAAGAAIRNNVGYSTDHGGGGGECCYGDSSAHHIQMSDNIETEKFATLPHLKKKENKSQPNDYVNPSELDIPIPPVPSPSYQNAQAFKYYNSLNTRSLSRQNSHSKDSYGGGGNGKMTVNEAKRKYSSLLRTNSLLRTSTQFEHLDSNEF